VNRPAPPATAGKLLFDDYKLGSYCKGRTPCIALLSASDHDGVSSSVDQQTLQKYNRQPNAMAHESLNNRILLREGYCAIYQCDSIIDFNHYNRNKTMWLSKRGGHEVGPIPPHWNKVSALKRWLPHYDGILLMDMDTTWVDFNSSIYDLYNVTKSIYSNGNPELIMIRRSEVSNFIVDTWWYYGTSPGCRYHAYPDNYRSQTINLDMPWFWFALLRAAEVYQRIKFECLDPCHGPEEYMSKTQLESHQDHMHYRKLWISSCYADHKSEISTTIQNIWYREKHLILEMNWGGSKGMSFEESLSCSIAVHLKDRDEMVYWLNRTAAKLNEFGCTHQSCLKANTMLMGTVMSRWSSDKELGDYSCIEGFYNQEAN